ncbi:MAG: hypothetical protein U9R06_02180, partial [Patescibacteria group bacterium]|nr:hypothetical protein [Patescibacteria group bacterium]
MDNLQTEQFRSLTPNYFLNIDIESWAVFLFALFLIIFGLLFFKKYLIRRVLNLQFYKHIIFLVRLPKEKPGDNEKEFTVQTLREEIARGETIFSSIGGLRAQRTFRSYFLGRNDHFSFEIVANNKEISFYVVAPENMARYVEQQINAHYPQAAIEEVEDYNIFHPQGKIQAGFLKTRRNKIFPIKTYGKMDVDPMNSIINVLSKLGENEGLAIQYIARSAKYDWHSAAAAITRRISQGKTIKEAIAKANSHPLSIFFSEVVNAAKPKTEAEKNKAINQTASRPTAMEEEMLKGIEEKNSKAGLDVNLRIVVCAKNKGNASLYLSNLASAFNQYNY